MALSQNFLCYEPRDGFINVYSDRTEGWRFGGLRTSRKCSDRIAKEVTATGDRFLYRIRIRMKPDFPTSQKAQP